MLKVKSELGVVEVEAGGNTREVIADLVGIVMSIHHQLEEKDPPAANALRDMLKDDDLFERFKSCMQAKVENNEKNRKIAEKVIELRKEIEKND